MDKAVVLVSGGMDSAALLAHVREHLDVTGLYALTFLYGQKHAREAEAARWQSAQAQVLEHWEIDISFFGEMTGAGSALTGANVPVPDLADLNEEQRRQPPTYVPNRNMVLLALAAAFAESHAAHHVFYGAQAQDHYGYWDCTPEFVHRMNAVLSLNRRTPVSIHAPFAGKSKTDVLRVGLELGVDYAHTWSCYRGAETPCDTCPSCVERSAAFLAAGVEDPLRRQRMS